MKKKIKIDELFKKELGNYTEAPPPAAWGTLEKRLGGGPSAPPTIPFTRFGYLAMLSGIIVIGVFVTRSISGNSNLTKNAAVNIATEANNITNGNPLNAQDNKDNAGSSSPKEAVTQSIEKRQDTAGTNTKAKNEKTHAANKSSNKYTSANSNVRNSGNQANKVVSEPIQQQNVYNSSAANIETPPDKITDMGQVQEPDTTSKQAHIDSSMAKNNLAVNNKMLPQKATKPNFKRFEAGIKGGYESGFDNDASKKLVVSPYLQYNITPKLAIMLQPAIKAADLSSRSIGGASSYYKVNNDGTLKKYTDSVSIPLYEVGTDWKWNYSYTQTHDSIVKTYATGGDYIEFEMPVVMKYYITKTFSVYGGVNIVYSKLTGVTEHTYTRNAISKTADTSILWRAYATPPQIPMGITYTGTPYSSYSGPQYPASQGSLLRFGYMLGFSYEFHKNWLFDALIQQSPVAPNVQAGYNVNTPISAPYFRLTIGYKLIK